MRLLDLSYRKKEVTDKGLILLLGPRDTMSNTWWPEIGGEHAEGCQVSPTEAIGNSSRTGSGA